MNVAKWKDVWKRFSGRGTYPHQLAVVLLFPLRRIVLSPERLVSHLHLTRSSRVLEVGPGPGFFSIDVARAVPQGRLELVDIQLEMLQKAGRRLRRAGIRNAGYAQANAVRLPFRNGVFDVAFLVAVLGEVPDPRACLTSIADVLRPGGLLAVVELPGDPDALTEAQLRDLTEGTGLEFVQAVRVSRGLLTSFRRGAKTPGTTAGMEETMAKTDFKSVDEYVTTHPEDVRSILQCVRRTIRKAVPDAEEVISYQIPTYKLPAGPVLSFAGWKQHYSLYGATGQLVAAFKDDLAPYKVDKGTIRFPLSQPVPVKLIERIAKFRAKEAATRATAKLAQPKRRR